MLSSKAPLREIALRNRAGSRCQRTREGGGEAGTEHSGFTLDESGRVGGALPPSPSIASPALPSSRLADYKHTRGLPKQPAPWTPMKEPGGQSNSSCSHLPWRLRAKLRMNAATHGADLLRVTSDFPFASKPKPNQAQPARRIPTHRTTRKPIRIYSKPTRIQTRLMSLRSLHSAQMPGGSR